MADKYAKGTTPGRSGSTGPKDKPKLPQAKGPHTSVPKTDPQGGSSQRSESREAIARVYEGIAEKESDVKKECDPDKDVTPDEEKVDWGGQEEPDDQKDDDAMQGIEAVEVPDDVQIRNLLKARPQI